MDSYMTVLLKHWNTRVTGINFHPKWYHAEQYCRL